MPVPLRSSSYFGMVLAALCTVLTAKVSQLFPAVLVNIFRVSMRPACSLLYNEPNKMQPQVHQMTIIIINSHFARDFASWSWRF